MMIKVKGTLNSAYYEDGMVIQPAETRYFKKYNLRCKLFILKMKLFYDWVEITRI